MPPTTRADRHDLASPKRCWASQQWHPASLPSLLKLPLLARQAALEILAAEVETGIRTGGGEGVEGLLEILAPLGSEGMCAQEGRHEVRRVFSLGLERVVNP